MQELKLCWTEMLVEITTRNCAKLYILQLYNRLVSRQQFPPGCIRSSEWRKWEIPPPGKGDRLAIQESSSAAEKHLLGCHRIFQRSNRKVPILCLFILRPLQKSWPSQASQRTRLSTEIFYLGQCYAVEGTWL